MKNPSNDENRFQLLWLLERQPDLSQRDLAREVGLSLGAVNYCLKALAAKGEIKIENFRTSENRLKYVYVLTPQGIQKRMSLTQRFLKNKLKEYNALRDEIAQLETETQRMVANFASDPMDTLND
jgi:EPS-associated MarR family transcriptional regulator